jgi:hypothetical protein
MTMKNSDVTKTRTTTMNELSRELQKRNIPSVLDANGNWTPQRRAEVFDLIVQNVFGQRPPEPVKMEFNERTPEECVIPADAFDPATLDFFNGEKAVFKKVRLVCHLSEADYPGLKTWPGPFEFDVNCFIPRLAAGQKIPAVVLARLRDLMTSRNTPVREIVERGVALFHFRCTQVVNDYPEQKYPELNDTGLDRLYFGDFRLRDNQAGRKGGDPGCIAFWSWGASRVMDYIQTLDWVDQGRVAISGHSRCGKTALYTGACDARFTLTHANGSGAGGVALSRGDTKQDLAVMAGWASRWFCENLRTNHASPLFDMHFAAACVAPRRLYVADADQDIYCDQNSDYLSCVAASEVWKRLGLKGFVHPDRLPQTGDVFHGGDIGYHLRPGVHALPLEDLMRMLDHLKF